jgi:MOSC domain-containing protein YiiM
MAAELIDKLAKEGFPVRYGSLGENLTTLGLNHLEWRSGQRFRAGLALIELTEPREPCKKLACYGRGIQNRILQASGESGFYASVLEGGAIHPGDIIQMEDRVVLQCQLPHL